MAEEVQKHQDGQAAKPALDDEVQHHLGDELRAAYNALAPKPAYLGDRALPAEFEHQLLRMEATLEVREKGLDAVRDALAIPEEPEDGDEVER